MGLFELAQRALYGSPGLPGMDSSEWDFFAGRKAENFGELFRALPGDFMGSLGKLMELSGRAGTSIAGHALSPIVEVDPTQPEPRRQKVREDRERGASGEEKLKTLTGTSEVPGMDFAANVAFDPLTFLGMGGPRQILRHTAAIPNATLRQSVEKALSFLDEIDTGYNTVSGEMVKTPVKLAGEGLAKVPVPGQLKVADEFGQQQAAGSLGNWLGSRSTEAQFKLHVRNMADMLNVLGQKGHRLALDIAEASPQMPRWPGTTEKAPAFAAAA